MTWFTQILESFTQIFRWWVVVAPWEAGLLVRLGKKAKVLGPGIHFRIPFLDRVYVQSTRLRTATTTGHTLTTKDGKALTISFAVQFSVADIEKLYMSLAQPEHTIITICEGHVVKIVANLDSHDLTAEQIGEAVTVKIPDYGLDDVKMFVTAIAFARTYRIISNEWRSSTGFDTEEPFVAGGRRQ